MAGRDIYEYIRLNGARWGVGPSPFSVEASLGQSPSGASGPTALTRMGRVGGLGNGGGKLQTATAQGRGAPAIIRPSGYAGHRQPAKAAPDQFPAATQAVNTVANVGGGFLTGLGNQASGMYQAVTSPIETGKAAFAGLRELVQNPQSGVDALKGLYDMATGSQRGFGQVLGELVPLPGPRGAGARRDIFIGKTSPQWREEDAKKADAMLKSRVPPEIVWQQTGTARGADGELRQEIPDTNSYLRREFSPRGIPVMQLGQALRHDELFKAYGPLADMVSVEWDPAMAKNVRGSFAPEDLRIRLNTSLDSEDARKVLLHEVQHVIQQAEDWGRGGNAAQALSTPQGQELFESVRRSMASKGPLTAQQEQQAKTAAALLYYKRLAGENEANAVMARSGLSAEELRALYPGMSYEIPLSQQIVRK